ncbi:MAG: DUF523 and DUF1722 domain-containing protein, partial [Deltaproteobacteria bacterium]|nr:DUF523 and DUF1722 domain-containing protein [Deltaproteobacteria bacterium]
MGGRKASGRLSGADRRPRRAPRNRIGALRGRAPSGCEIVSATAQAAGPPIRLGVSSCLLGQEVRFDGGHKRDRFLTELLGSFVEWVPVCPEVEVGMGTPRPALRLVRDGEGEAVRMLEIASGRDHTRAMQRYAAQRVRALGGLELCGYVLKKDSPSCGMTRVKVYGEKGGATRDGRGLFALQLLDAYPNLPVEDEGRLNDARLRENFIERVFAYKRLRDLFRGRWTPGQLVAFHTAHKLQLMAHAMEPYRELGALVASVKKRAREEVREQYQDLFMAALARVATPARNTNVLQHAAGHLKKGLDSASRTELAELICDYRREEVPLVVPLTLLRHHARRLDVSYLNGQTFLEPHPKELMLR